MAILYRKTLTAALVTYLLAAPALAQDNTVTFALGYNSNGSSEGYLGWRGTALRYGFQPVIGASFSTRSEGWVGAGLAYTWRAGTNPGFVRAAVMPGLYRQGSGRDLGGLVMFRSSLEVGMALRGGGEVSLGVAHRSNAGIYARNPGMNTVYLGYSVALN